MKGTIKNFILPFLTAVFLVLHSAGAAWADEVVSTASQSEASGPPGSEASADGDPGPEESDGTSDLHASYGVTIGWSNMDFECAPLWNPDTHRYDSWKSNDSRISVTNSSDQGFPLRITLRFVPVSSDTGVSAVFTAGLGQDSERFEIADGQITFTLLADGSDGTEVTLSLSGKPAAREYKQIGSIITEVIPLGGDSPPVKVPLPESSLPGTEETLPAEPPSAPEESSSVESSPESAEPPPEESSSSAAEESSSPGDDVSHPAQSDDPHESSPPPESDASDPIQPDPPEESSPPPESATESSSPLDRTEDHPSQPEGASSAEDALPVRKQEDSP